MVRAVIYCKAALVTALTCIVLIGVGACAYGKGTKLVMEVGLDEFVRSMANNPDDSVLNKSLADAVSASKTGKQGFVPLWAAIFQKENPGKRLAGYFVKPSNSIHLNNTDAAVIFMLSVQADMAVNKTIKILQARISIVTVDTPQMVYDVKKGTITATLNTTADMARITALISNSGSLEFLETYTNAEANPMIITANDLLAQITDTFPKVKNNEFATDTTDAYKREADAIRKNPLYAVLQPALNAKRDALAYGPVVGYAIARDTAKLNMYFAVPQVRHLFPEHVQLVYGFPYVKRDTAGYFPVYLVKTYVDNSAAVNNDCIIKAYADTDSYSGKPVIQLDMNPIGTARWEKMTTRNKGKFIAFLLDDRVYSCPRVDNTIRSGNTEIMGNLTATEAGDYARVLMSGKLPVPVRIVTQ